MVATLDENDVSHIVKLPGGGSTPLARCETIRAFDQNGRTAVVDGQLLCSERNQDTRGVSRIVDLKTDRTLLDLGSTAIFRAAFGPPGDAGLPHSVVVVDRDNPFAVTLYDLDRQSAVGSYVEDSDSPESVAMSPDGARLALLMYSGRLIVLDTQRFVKGDDQSDAIVFDVPAHAAGSKAVAFSDSGLIATGSSLDGIRVWSGEGEPVASVPTHQEDDPTFAFVPGTDTLYYEDGDGVVRRFGIDVDETVQLARSRLTRGFTPQECARYFPNEPCPTLGPQTLRHD